MNDDKISYLKNVDFLSGLNSLELTELATDFNWGTFTKGSIVIQQGEKQHSFYLLINGQVEIIAPKEKQPSEVVRSLKPGDTFGELSLLTGQASAYTYQVIEDCQVISLNNEDFARMLLRWPQIYRSFIGQLSKNLNEVNSKLSETKYREVLSSAIKLNQYKDKFYGIWGTVRSTKEVERKFEEIKRKQGHLLLTGERGTGRQMMAWYAHQHLFGETAPFVVVDGQRFDQQWGNLIKEQVDQKDSLTINFSLFDIAMGGTLFIQEINLISPKTQLILAQALKEHTAKCFLIGSIKIDRKGSGPKLIPELQECFGHTHNITPLRERKRDIPILVQGILEKLAQKNQRKAPVLSREATQLLLSHDYRQGNVTELIQVVERSFFLAENDIISLDQIFFGPTAQKIGQKINLLQWAPIEDLLRKGAFILTIRYLTAFLFMFLILTLIFTPSGTTTSKVFLLVWGLWWPALAIISPFLGRLWCTVCPFSTIMEFAHKKLHLNRPVPAMLLKYDFLIVSALFLLIFWIEIITGMRSSPAYTVILLIIIQLAAIIIGVIYPRHTWCRHLCPLGGFIGTASIGSLLEVRADASVCLNKCTTFECYVGKDEVKGCPMSQHLPYLDNNLDCKLCFNCVRNCPNGSVQVNLRIPAREVWHLVRVNQGYTIFIGVMLAILFPINYFEPLQKTWPPSQWNFWFTVSYLIAAIFGGIITWVIAKPFKTKAASKRVKLIFAFTPLVLGGHIMYQVNHIPGINKLLLGAGVQTSAGLQSLFISATTVAQGMAAIIGLFLTGVTVAIILIHKKERQNVVNQNLNS